MSKEVYRRKENNYYNISRIISTIGYFGGVVTHFVAKAIDSPELAKNSIFISIVSGTYLWGTIQGENQYEKEYNLEREIKQFHKEISLESKLG